MAIRHQNPGTLREKAEEIDDPPWSNEGVKPFDLLGLSEYGFFSAQGPEQEAGLPRPESWLDHSPLPASADELGERFVELATGMEPVPLVDEQLSAEEWAALSREEREQLRHDLALESGWFRSLFDEGTQRK
jgi:hypothetical protein